MADRDYYSAQPQRYMGQAQEALISENPGQAADHIVYQVIEQLKKLIKRHPQLIPQCMQVLQQALQSPQGQHVQCPPIQATDKHAELVRKAVCDILTDLEYDPLFREHCTNLEQELLARACVEIQEWELLSRLEVNENIGQVYLNNASDVMEATRERTEQEFRNIAAEVGSWNQLQQYQNTKPDSDTDGPEKIVVLNLD